jgi:hypothetical protein
VSDTRPARRYSVWRKSFALPSEHGAWIWWIGPMVVGAAAAGRLVPDFAILCAAALAAFLLRQPVVMAVKVISGRRPREDLPAAAFWTSVYSLIGAMAVASLVARGHPSVLWLALPGVAVFTWHLWLISRRQERGQMGIELVGAGVLALAAPAALWVCGSGPDQRGWLLWGLTWLQSAASIVLVYHRLAQRRLSAAPPVPDRWRMGARAILYHVFNLAFSTTLAAASQVPALVPVAFGLMLLDALEGIGRPPIGARPTAIGFRQLGASLAFVVVMAAAYLV